MERGFRLRFRMGTKKKVLFQGTRKDLENHAKNCKIKKCQVCMMAKETFQRWDEEEEEISL